MKLVSRITRRGMLGATLALPLLARAAFAEEGTAMRLRFRFHDQVFTATLEDNVSARELLGMLPLNLAISDFSSNEKIAYLPTRLTQLARGPVPNAAAGDLCYYVPWGNLAFFYRGYESTPDLVRLARVDGGIEPLLVRGEFPLRVEVA